MHVTHEPMNLEVKVDLKTKTLVTNGIAPSFKLLNLKKRYFQRLRQSYILTIDTPERNFNFSVFIAQRHFLHCIFPSHINFWLNNNKILIKKDTIICSLIYTSGSQPYGIRIPPNRRTSVVFDILCAPLSCLHTHWDMRSPV